jgi:NTP pyrophosphatase (non-canonical NTP hydrolase)
MLIFANIKHDRIKVIADKYGINLQTTKALEELAELQQAICKLNLSIAQNKGFEKEIQLKGNVKEEIADVVIMINQLLYLFDIDEGHIASLIDFKLKRQIERIENEKK